MKKLSILLIAAMILLTACAPQQSGPAKAELPAGKAYAEGKEIYFVHTEASDADVAEKLTAMMESPVILCLRWRMCPLNLWPMCTSLPMDLKGSGPFGFQPDVFDNPPGTDGYSPLAPAECDHMGG